MKNLNYLGAAHGAPFSETHSEYYHNRNGQPLSTFGKRQDCHEPLMQASACLTYVCIRGRVLKMWLVAMVVPCRSHGFKSRFSGYSPLARYPAPSSKSSLQFLMISTPRQTTPEIYST